MVRSGLAFLLLVAAIGCESSGAGKSETAPPAVCQTAADCDDGEPCNGEETCDAASGNCRSGPPLGAGETCVAGDVAGTCRGGFCAASSCGNGRIDADEDCDDANVVAGDGCEGDCRFSCKVDADCDDGQPCNGDETCDDSAHLCHSGTAAPDGTACSRADESDGACRGGVCATADCGNATVDEGEDCDDGNTVGDDGCRNDCTYTCRADAECDRGTACRGTATCDPASHVCAYDAPPENGMPCDLDGLPATREICLSGGCAPSRCGDGFVDPGATPPETCDDANTADGDGCEGDCDWTCDTDEDCDDHDVCSGNETCDVVTHLCSPGTAPRNGSPCDADGDAGTIDICVAGSCALSRCGDGFAHTVATPAEACDDGNAVDGDGCNSDCQWSCASNGDSEDNGDVCDGVETCDLSTHTCRIEGRLPGDGSPCSPCPGCRSGVCSGGHCVSPDCGNGTREGQEQCDDGNDDNADGCTIGCRFTCDDDADCSDGNSCTQDTCGPGGTGQVCSNANLPDGVPCTSGFVDHCHTDRRCQAGVCQGTEVDCDDSNPCTIDTCSAPFGCQHEATGYYAWRDDDGDHFGSDERECLPLDISYPVPFAGDCCDGHPQVNPLAGWQHVPYSCDGTGPLWDWNCDGSIQYSYPSTGACYFENGCCAVAQGWRGPIPYCGEYGEWIVDCVPTGECDGGEFISCMRIVIPVRQMCR